MTQTSPQTAPTAPTAPLFLTVPQAARLLQLGVTRVYGLCAARETNGFPAVRLDGTWRIPSAALERWVNDQAGNR